MKRRRRIPFPTIFSPSDSDSDSPPSNQSRFRPKASLRDEVAPVTAPPNSNPSPSDVTTTTTAAANIASTEHDAPTSTQPDSLDTFMNALQSSSKAPSGPSSTNLTSHASKPTMLTCPSSYSSDDELTLSSAPATTSLNATAVAADDDASDEIESRPRDVDHQRQQYALPPVDYSSHQGPPVTRLSFISPDHLDKDPSSIARRTAAMRATVRNGHAPIISSFHDTCPPAPHQLVDKLASEFPSPTPIQALTFPYALAGRDLVAIAQTGSGKTIAYALPLLVHVAMQMGSSKAGHGPVGLVLVPTRELATQIADVLNAYGECISVSCCCVVGGVAKYEQFKQIRDSGASIIVSTPGRLIDMLRMRACRMKRCSFVVLDEADRMLDLGFGPQVRTVLSQIRPDAQLTLFSATMPKFVERLISDFLKDPVHISFTGGIYHHTAMVTDNVTDCFLLFDDDKARQKWLLDHLSGLVNEGLLIIFCTTRGDSAELSNIIRFTGMPTACVHGETDQSDREALLRMFRANELPILVTTDVAARGLDIADVQNVINYGCAKSWEWHVHRVGRCGRASEKGSAFTLMDCKSQLDITFANEACNVLRREKRSLPPALVRLHELSRKLREGQRRGRYKRSRG